MREATGLDSCGSFGSFFSCFCELLGRLLEQGVLAAMRALYLGPLPVRWVFQMLIAIFAGTFICAGF